MSIKVNIDNINDWENYIHHMTDEERSQKQHYIL